VCWSELECVAVKGYILKCVEFKGQILKCVEVC